MRAAVLFLVLISSICLCTNAYCWDDTGHEVVAVMASSLLTVSARQAVSSILSADPDHDVRRVDLIGASTWPDRIKSDPNFPESRRHPEWHYVDVPIGPSIHLTNAEIEQALNAPDTVGWAIQLNLALLRDRNTDPLARADALCWVVHLVADIHQPLHCCTLIQPPDFIAPKGDLGGNHYYFSHPTNDPLHNRKLPQLHAFWDTAPDRMPFGNSIYSIASGLLMRYPATRLPRVHSDNISLWATESLSYTGFAYSTPLYTVPSPSYSKLCTSISAERLARAGYRLADVLNAAL